MFFSPSLPMSLYAFHHSATTTATTTESSSSRPRIIRQESFTESLVQPTKNLSRAFTNNHTHTQSPAAPSILTPTHQQSMPTLDLSAHESADGSVVEAKEAGDAGNVLGGDARSVRIDLDGVSVCEIENENEFCSDPTFISANLTTLQRPTITIGRSVCLPIACVPVYVCACALC